MTTRLAWPLLFIPVLAAPLMFPAAAAGADPLATIGAYAGTWQTHIDHVRTKFSRARSEDMQLKNVCWRSENYYVCNQIVGGKSAALIVFTYSAATKKYTTNTILPNGKAPPSGSLLIDGKTWTYPWQDTDAGKPVYLRVVNTFLSPEKIRYRQEFSLDKIHWTVTARGLETKQT